jgi:hypothetical protein
VVQRFGCAPVLFKETKNVKENMQWISVKERLPVEYIGLYLLVTNGIEVWIGDYDPRPKPKERWGVVYNGAPPFDSTEITHWMPMPPAPGSEPNSEPVDIGPASNGTIITEGLSKDNSRAVTETE